jgi:hypothetical protein
MEEDSNKPKIPYRREPAAVGTVNRLKRGSITKDTRKRIMVLCPICKDAHILQGRERYLYIREAIQRKSLKYGKTCSPECQKQLMNPKTRKQAHKVAHLYRELPRLSRIGRPPGSKNIEKPHEVTPTAIQRKKDGARQD